MSSTKQPKTIETNSKEPLSEAFRSAISKHQGNKNSEALEQMNNILEKEYYNPDYYEAAGDITSYISVDGAMEFYKKALLLNPKRASTRKKIKFLEEKYYENVVKHLLQFLSKEDLCPKTSETPFKKASWQFRIMECYVKGQKYSLGEEFFEKAKLEKNHAFYYRLLYYSAVCKRNLERYPQALDYLNQFIDYKKETNINMTDVYYERGLTHEALGNYPEAVQDFEKAVKNSDPSFHLPAKLAIERIQPKIYIEAEEARVVCLTVGMEYQKENYEGVLTMGSDFLKNKCHLPVFYLYRAIAYLKKEDVKGGLQEYDSFCQMANSPVQDFEDQNAISMLVKLRRPLQELFRLIRQYQTEVEKDLQYKSWLQGVPSKSALEAIKKRLHGASYNSNGISLQIDGIDLHASMKETVKNSLLALLEENIRKKFLPALENKVTEEHVKILEIELAIGLSKFIKKRKMPECFRGNGPNTYLTVNTQNIKTDPQLLQAIQEAINRTIAHSSKTQPRAIQNLVFSEQTEIQKLIKTTEEVLLDLSKQPLKPKALPSKRRFPESIYQSKNNVATQLNFKGPFYEGSWNGNARDGNGIQYWRNGICYSGQWKDDKRHGYGNLVLPNGVIYMGRLTNEKYDGFGSYFWTNGNWYSGIWEKGVFKNGNISFKWSNGTKYEGGYNQGKFHLEGTYNWKNGNSYSGGWNNGIRHGSGTFKWAKGNKYQGSFKDGKMHGKGTFSWSNGNSYTGDWKDNVRCDGQGVMKSANGSRYEGNFVKGKKQGRGTFYWADGRKYEGDWDNNLMHGTGTMKYKSGDTYKGPFKNGFMEGEGTLTWVKGGSYTGRFEKNLRHGNGVETSAKGAKYRGKWNKGQKDGTGEYTLPNGARFTGTWSDITNQLKRYRR